MHARTTRRRAAITAAALLVAAVAMTGLAAAQPESGAAAQPASDLPSAESIFERHIEAIGGRDAIWAHTDRRIVGTFEGEPFTGAARLKIWSDAPDKLHIEIKEPLGIDVGIYYTGEYGWEEFNGGEPVPIFGPRLVELVESADFYGEANYRQRYSEYETEGAGELKGTPVWVVRAVASTGRARRLFFAQDSGLFVGEHSSVARMSEGGELEARFVEILHENYTEIDGVLVPTRQTQYVQGEERPIVFNYTSVRVNTSDEHEYRPPEPQRTELESRIEELLEQVEKNKSAHTPGG